MATNETIADIVQSMRGYAAAMDERFKKAAEGDKRLNCNTIAFRMRVFANRIEAASNREVVTDYNLNNAKMREALDEIKNTANNALTTLFVGNCPSSSLWDIIRKCEAALAAPPRNCDLPTVIAKPHGAWIKDCDNWDDFGNPKKEIHEWLLAKAKGDNK